MKNNFCGLDFGTSNSTVGIFPEETPCLVPLENSKSTIPSALFFDFEENTTSFGRKAVAEYIDGAEGRLMRALKSVLGSSLVDETTRIGHKSVSFQDILGTFIRHLKQQAEGFAGHEIDQVVLGRPVHFVDNNPTADQKAQNTLEEIARAQGFKHVSFQYEPVAAALNYEQSVTSEKIALIIDIGGGTSDFSVVRVSPQGHKKPDRNSDVLSNTGVHIGGTDFDKLLSLQTVMPRLGYLTTMRDPLGSSETTIPATYYHDLATWQKINFLYTRQKINEIRNIASQAKEKNLVERLLHVVESRQGHWLAMQVEESKIELTKQKAGLINLNLISRGLNLPVNREDLHNAINDRVEKLKLSVAEALKKAQISGEKIDTIFLTGGSTSIPIVCNTLTQISPHAEVVKGDVFGSVGIGLTIDSYRKYGAKPTG